jgi:hypothetical protein
MAGVCADKPQIRAFLKNVGSNFMLNSKRLEISPKNGWRANDFIS